MDERPAFSANIQHPPLPASFIDDYIYLTLVLGVTVSDSGSTKRTRMGYLHFRVSGRCNKVLIASDGTTVFSTSPGLLQVCHSVPGVHAYAPVPAIDLVPVPALTLPLRQVTTNALSLNALQACSTSVDLSHHASASYDILNMSTPLLHQTFKMAVQVFTRRFFLFLKNPYFVSIHASYRDIFLYLILMHSLHYIPHEEPRVLSCLAFLRALRNTILKHDFLARCDGDMR